MTRDIFEDALAAEGVSGKLADLARSIYTQESGRGRNTRTSNRGAVGGMQILPATFEGVADRGWDIENPAHNARAGIRYLKQLDKQAGGDAALTAAGYYGGPGGLEKARRGQAVKDPKNPKAPNTLQYADQVVSRLGTGGGGGESSPLLVESAQVAQAPQTPPAPQAGPTTIPLPDELVTYLTNRATALGGQSPAQADAWLSFLKAMPQARGQARPQTEAPVFQAQAIDWAHSLRPVAAPAGKVDFGPFAAFGRVSPLGKGWA